MQRMLMEVEKSRCQSKKDVDRLTGSLLEVEEKLTTPKNRLIGVAIEGVEAFKQSMEYHQVVLQSWQKAYQWGFKKCKRKPGKHLPKLDLSEILLLSLSSLSDGLVGA